MNVKWNLTLKDLGAPGFMYLPPQMFGRQRSELAKERLVWAVHSELGTFKDREEPADGGTVGHGEQRGSL